MNICRGAECTRLPDPSPLGGDLSGFVGERGCSEQLFRRIDIGMPFPLTTGEGGRHGWIHLSPQLATQSDTKILQVHSELSLVPL